MKYVSTILLRIAIIGYGAFVLLFSIFLLPQPLKGIAEDYSVAASIAAGIGLYGSLIMLFVALYQAFRLLNLIDKNKAFTMHAVKSLRVIKFVAFIAVGLFAASLPLFYGVAQLEDAPGVMLIALAMNGVPLVVGIFAGVMQSLLQNAIKMKKENDLTV